MERFEKKYSIDEVFAFVKDNGGMVKVDGKKRVEFDGHNVKPYSLRYLNFIHNGTKCVCCGIEGTHFYKERTATVSGAPNPYNGWHFNLYGTTENGEEMLMTKDHILAKKLGGKDTVTNFQTMCTRCNGKKGHMTLEQWDEYKRTGVYPEGYQPKTLPDPDSNKSKKRKKRKKADPMGLDRAIVLAKQHRKQVFLIKTLGDKYCIADDLAHAQKKYKNHIVELYEWE